MPLFLHDVAYSQDFYRTFKQTLGDKWDPKKMHEVCHYLFTMMDTNRVSYRLASHDSVYLPYFPCLLRWN